MTDAFTKVVNMSMNRALITVAFVLVIASLGASAQLASLRITRLGLVNVTNSQSAQFVAGTNTVQQNVSLPPTMPSVGQSIKATAIAGPSVTTAWASMASGSGSGSGAGVIVAINAVNSIPASYDDIFSGTLEANTAYVLNGRFTLATGNSGPPNLDLQWVLPSGATVVTTIVNASTGDIYTTMPTSVVLLNTNTTYTIVLTGVLTMGGTAGPAKLQGQKNGGGAAPGVGVGSYISFIP